MGKEGESALEPMRINMGDHKEQEDRLHRWFGPENNHTSSLSDSSDRVSITSSTSFSSLSRKFRVPPGSTAAVWGNSEANSSGELRKATDSSSSTSSGGPYKYRKVTSSSSCVSSQRSTCGKMDSPLSLLHEHKSRRKKKYDSSSSEEKNDGGSSSSDTRENEDSPPSSQNILKPGGTKVGPFVSFRIQENDGISSNSSDTSDQERQTTSLECAQNNWVGHADRDQNDSECSSSSQDAAMSKLSSSTDNNSDDKELSKSKNGNSSSSDTKDETYASSTSYPNSESSDQNDSRLLDIVVDALDSYLSSSNSDPSDDSVQGSAKQTREVSIDAPETSEKAPSIAQSDESESKEEEESNEYALEDRKLPSTDNCKALPSIASSSSSAKVEKDATESATSTFDDVIYRDYSHVKPEETGLEMVEMNVSSRLNSKKELPFPKKLHKILSHPDSKEWITWLPHGRAWKILNQTGFKDNVIPRFFRHCKLKSFMRQVNIWGFKRVPNGPDENSYYHELFLRGLPHVCDKMFRQPNSKKEENGSKSVYSMVRVTPDFYQISKEHPLPDENGVFPPTREATSAMDYTVSQTIPQFPDKGQHASSSSINKTSTNSSVINGTLPDHNAVGSSSNILSRSSIDIASSALNPFQLAQHRIAQQNINSAQENSLPIAHIGAPGIGNISRIGDIGSALVGGPLFGSTVNQQFYPSNAFTQNPNPLRNALNGTGQLSTASNIGHSIVPSCMLNRFIGGLQTNNGSALATALGRGGGATLPFNPLLPISNSQGQQFRMGTQNNAVTVKNESSSEYDGYASETQSNWSNGRTRQPPSCKKDYR